MIRINNKIEHIIINSGFRLSMCRIFVLDININPVINILKVIKEIDIISIVTELDIMDRFDGIMVIVISDIIIRVIVSCHHSGLLLDLYFVIII